MWGVKMISKILKKIIWLIGANLRASKAIDVENNYRDRFFYNVHNILFMFLLCLAILTYTDLWVFKSSFSSVLFQWLGMGDIYQKDLPRSHLRLYYYTSTVVSVGAGLLASIVFYIQYGDVFRRYDLPRKKSLFNNIYTIWIRDITVGPALIILLSFLFFLGGFLAGIRFPEVVNLDLIPGVLLLQLYILIQVQAMIGSLFYGLFQNMYPYSLHPRRVKSKMEKHHDE